jgi:hypothetical protein
MRNTNKKAYSVGLTAFSLKVGLKILDITHPGLTLKNFIELYSGLDLSEIEKNKISTNENFYKEVC